MIAGRCGATKAAAFLLSAACSAILACTPSDKPLKPPGLGYHAMACDAESGVIVLFGGQLKDYTPTSVVSATWAYDCSAGAWRKMSPPEKPPAVSGHALAYDTESDRVVLFCGQTWAYDYNTDSWERMNPERAPAGAFGYSMAYDEKSDRVVLFGVQSNDTWVYDLNSDTWTAMSPAISPPKRQYQSLAYDGESDRVVLFGGGGTGGLSKTYTAIYDDTWAYDYDTDSWEELEPPARPEKRVYHAMVYDSAIDRVVLFGGWSEDSSVPIDNQLWAFDLNAAQWERIAAEQTLTPKRKHAMAYDARTNSIVIYGGITAPPLPASEPPFTKDLWVIRL